MLTTVLRGLTTILSMLTMVLRGLTMVLSMLTAVLRTLKMVLRVLTAVLRMLKMTLRMLTTMLSGLIFKRRATLTQRRKGTKAQRSKDFFYREIMEFMEIKKTTTSMFSMFSL
jgi:hypothetical protein